MTTAPPPMPERLPTTAAVRALRPLLRTATALALLTAVVALVPGSVGDTAGALMVVVLVGTPLARVAWLAARWWRTHDRRFSLAAAALLVLVAGGAAIAAWA
jgi:hypothetical protein